jgi:DNA-binding SARP family transcriptional activator
MTVRLRTLGRLSLERECQEVNGPAVQPRRLALLALLAAAGEAGLTREKLLGFLWPEHPAARARQILAESLFVLRGALGKSVIVAPGDYLRLSPEEVWTDVGAFEARMAAGALREAVDLYRGPFLDGFYVRDALEFEQWLGREQDRLSREYGRALETLAQQSVADGDPTGAAEWWRRLASHEPFSSRVALRYVEALVRAGEPILAKRHAAEFTERMRAELGIEPELAILDRAKELVATSAPSAAARAPLPREGEVAPRDDGGPASDLLRSPPLAGTQSPPSLGPPSGGLEGLGNELEVVGIAGEGSVARVYVAREHTLRRLVAVKVLSPAFSADETARARFEREALAAASILHPNVAPIYRTGRLASGSPYLVMPYFHGGSLENRLKLSGPLAPEEGVRFIRQIAAALAAAHRSGIVHRDVRPANILYDHSANRVVLIDFGIAAVLDAANEYTSRLTRPGERLGTPVYISPEQLRGEPVTDRSDVYSLGVVAFELLTGRLPFEAHTPVQLMRAHATSEPPKLSDIRPEIGAELDCVVQMCLRKRPTDRPLAADVAEEVAK